jgi:hypothetical protein
MMQELNDTKTIGTRRSRKVGLLLLSAAVILIAAVAVWMSPGGAGGRDQASGLVRTETGNPGTVGTSGTLSPDQDSGAGAAGHIIRELSTITGVNDGHQFVGRRVELSAPINQHINDIAFWIGEGDNRLLVVLARDDRDGAERQRGEPADKGLTLDAGRRAAVAGTIQQVPYAEAMYSWGLTNSDRAELMDRRVYLRADSVTPVAN